MAKCTRCGKHGLFLKVNSSRLCNNCAEEAAHQERLVRVRDDLLKVEQALQNKSALLESAKAEAKSAALIELEAEHERLTRENASMVEKLLRATAERDTLEQSNVKATEAYDALAAKIEKLRPMANTIKNAYERWIMGDTENTYDNIVSLNIAELLPPLELNCMTVKQLRSRCTMLRKQIVSLCADYESRYTTKANATIYKLMVLALEAELGLVLGKLSFGKLDAAVDDVKELTSRYYAIAAEGNQSIAPTIRRFIGQLESLYLEVVACEYEYHVQRERAKEEQKALREQMRQEAEERKRLEQERKHVEAEEKKYQAEIDRITEQMKKAHADELEALRKRLAEVTESARKVEDKKAEIINLQNGKAGTVYIISNIGAFGDHMYKIGMTRRLDPQDRINELGDASVPFPFDVHSFIFSEDAVSLETALHKELNNRRVNKVNLRKEFFDISIEELQQIVERIDPTAPFRVTALAEQYRQSLSIADVPDELPIIVDEVE